MRSIIGLLFLGMILSANADAVYLRYCQNYNNTFSLNFGFCVNDNFSNVQRAIGQGLFLRSCHNTSTQGVSMLYEHCINDNFSRIAQKLDGQVFFRFCNNSSNHEVSWMFVNCINDNFDRLEREL